MAHCSPGRALIPSASCYPSLALVLTSIGCLSWCDALAVSIAEVPQDREQQDQQGGGEAVSVGQPCRLTTPLTRRSISSSNGDVCPRLYWRDDIPSAVYTRGRGKVVDRIEASGYCRRLANPALEGQGADAERIAALAQLRLILLGRVLAAARSPGPDRSVTVRWLIAAAGRAGMPPGHTRPPRAGPTGAHVVKAFGTLFGHVLAADQADDRPLDVFIAGDDEGAKARV